MSVHTADTPSDARERLASLGDVSGQGTRLRALASDLQGSLWLAYLRVHHRRFVRDARPVAAHLAEEILPTFRKHGQKSLSLVIETKGSRSRFLALGDHIHFEMPAPTRFVRCLREANLTDLRLDTRLGATEIVESLLLAVHAAPALHTPASSSSRGGIGGTWNSRRFAEAALTDTGFQGFSTRLRFDKVAGRTEVRYSPRDIFGSRAITRWMLRHTSTRDSRDILRVSTKAGFLAFLILIVPLLSFTWNSMAGSIIWLLCSLVVAAWVSAAVSTIGSVLYDRERRDRLIHGYIREIDALSDFAMTSPNPLLELSDTGEIRFMNAATRRLLERLKLPVERARDALPEDLLGCIRATLSGRSEPVENEIEVAGRVIHYAFERLPGGGSVVAAGTDITRVRKMEADLRVINEHLESLAAKRALETQEATVLCLARLAEIRDPETGAHLERVKRYVGVLARRLATETRFAAELDEETIDLIMKTAPLHDIGKVGVPDSILLKPARLGPEETDEMHRHAVYGGDALSWVSERLGESRFFHLAKEIAYYHHERWDGSGYPFGLVGDAIPLAARLMALADVYDALRSPRVYRPELSHEEVREIIIEERGRHFDPDIVDAFVATEHAFMEIASAHGDRATVS